MSCPKLNSKDTCSVEGCVNPRYFSFPTDDALARKIWVDRIGDSALKRNFSICTSHFHKSCFTERKEMKKVRKGEKALQQETVFALKRGSLPTMFLPKFKIENEEEALQFSNHKNMKLSKGEEALTRINLQAPVKRTSLIENVCSVSGCKNTKENTIMHPFPTKNETCPRKKKCSAPDCNTDSLLNPELSFFRFPQNFRNNQLGRHKLWRKVIWLSDGDPAHFLCERHFAKHDVVDGRLRLNANPSYPTGFLNPVTNNYSPLVEYELRSGHESAKEKPYHEYNFSSHLEKGNEVPIPTSSKTETFVVESINTGEHAIPAHIVFDLAIQYVDHFSLASAEQTKFLKRCQNFAKRNPGEIMEFFWKRD